MLGSPIAHSLSPRLHRAAYGALGLDWQYDAIDVPEAALATHLDSLDSRWRGLSLTMPLKRLVLPLLDDSDELVRSTGVANTVLLGPAGRTGFNTDVYGITRAFRDHGVNSARTMIILGGGATAISAVVAGHQLGAVSAQVWVRTPSRASGIRELAAELGVDLEIRALTEPGSGGDAPDIVISTLPNGAVIDLGIPPDFLRHSVLFDVAYDPWPTALAQLWQRAGGRVIPGIDMLVNQALLQVRIFVAGDPKQVVPDETGVLHAMRASVAR